MEASLNDIRDPFAVIDGADGEPQNVPPLSDDEKKILGPIEKEFEVAKRMHADRKGLIDYCTLMLKGETLVAQIKNAEYLRTIVDGNPQRPRSTDNKLRVANRAFVSKLIKIIPMIRTRPRTNDRDDMIAADLIDSYIDSCWQSQQLKLLYKRWVSWIPRAGMGIIQPWWNTAGGRMVLTCPDCGATPDRSQYKVGEPCPACSAEMMAAQPPMPPTTGAGPAGAAPSPVGPPLGGMQAPSPMQPPALQEVREGELCSRIVDPRDFYPDPGAVSPEEMQYAFVSRVLPVPQIRKMFPDKWQLIYPEQGLYSDKYITATYSAGLRRARIETRYLTNHARLFEYYEMPSGKYKRGRIVYYSCGRLLKTTENIPAWLLGRLQFFLCRGDVDEGELWPEPIVLQAEALQRERDVLMTQKRHHRDLTVNPPILVAWNSGIDDKFLDRTPGKVIRVKPSPMDPRPMRVAQFPAYVAQEPQELADAIFEKWGVTPHELGQTISGDSGRFAALLETQAQSVVAGMLIEIYAEWIQFHKALVILGQRYYAKDRIWTATGKDRTRAITKCWNDADVKEGWDLFFVEDDAMSKNPVMRMNQATQLKQTVPELFMDPQTGRFDEHKFRLQAGLKLESTSADDEAGEHIYAAKIPDMIKDGMAGLAPMPQPTPWDDPKVMAEELRKWLQTQGRNADPQLVQAVFTFWRIYVDELIAQLRNGVQDPSILKLVPTGGMMARGPIGPPQTMGPGAPPGGSQTNVQNNVATGQATEDQQTAGKIHGADRAAEQMARGAMKHEG